MWPALDSGRLLEVVSDGDPRGMTVLDRTRLTGQLLFFLLLVVTPFSFRSKESYSS